MARRRLDLKGCLVQAASLVAAAASILFVVSPLGLVGLVVPIAILAAAWAYALRRRHRFECGACGSELASKDVAVCPACGQRFD